MYQHLICHPTTIIQLNAGQNPKAIIQFDAGQNPTILIRTMDMPLGFCIAG